MQESVVAEAKVITVLPIASVLRSARIRYGVQSVCETSHRRHSSGYVPCPKNTNKSFLRWGPQSDADLKQ
jgi:hypothetical protein